MAERPVRAVVVDDEPAAREAIRALLAAEPRVEIVGEAGNGEEAVELVTRLAPDLLFLDVQMPDRDGFGVLAALGEDVPPGIIFVTAHDEHAIRAFEVHALDYLLKPFGRRRFEGAVSRALERLAAADALSMRRTLEQFTTRRDRGEPGQLGVHTAGAAPGTRSGDPLPRRLAVRNGTRVVLLDVESIDWVEAEGDYVRLHSGDAAHLAGERLHVLDRLLGPAGFLRIHRSVLVNTARLRELHREADGGATAVLQNGVQLRVSRSRRADVERALGLG